ncbi:hypothetical protein GCM10022280_22040 [Sphingomonas swuensis]|uniref:Lipoprotein n=1 Tax=Sphingomonas swuensis TaxID=977800 RepID=A0ABP7T6S0_9SPHN
MRPLQLLAFVLMSAHCAVGNAQRTPVIAPPATRQLSGLGSPEADSLLAKVKDAQRRLSAGEVQTFELLAGSVASSEAARISPREAFLGVPFDKVWKIERVRTDNRLWQPFKLAYAPKGLGQLYWDIEVVLGFNGDIEQVSMTYKVPAPF